MNVIVDQEKIRYAICSVLTLEKNMSHLRHLANCINQTLKNEIDERIKGEVYDLYSLKALFLEFFKEVENRFDMEKYDRRCMSIPLIWKRSTFNENDYKVSKREDLQIEIDASHWGYFITNFYVNNRIDLDLLCIKDKKTGKKRLFLGGFQKRFVLDSDRLNDDGSEKYEEIKCAEDLYRYKEEWTYYSRVFENQEKTELKEHIDNDDSCSMYIEDATLSDFLLFKDFLEHICLNIENGNYC
jgi:hypothetical protein